jgi:oligo-1,6-glucosidase
VALKRTITRWQAALADDGWNSLFWGNHDLPRAVSKYGDATGYHVESAKMLATVLHMLKGTPYVYQGEEIGMTNVPFTSIDQYRDIETLNMHRLHLEAGLPEADFIAGANANGRDNSRTPMQWSADSNAGFTVGTPWIDVNPNYTHINVEAARHDPESILAHFRRLIALRKDLPVIVEGRYAPWLEDHPHVMAYTRSLAGQAILVLANFTARSVTVDVPAALRRPWTTLIGAAAPAGNLPPTLSLAPFEANVWASSN